MSERHYLALLGVELRRGFPTVLRSTGTLMLLIVIFLAFGQGTAPRIAFLLTVISFSSALNLPMTVVKAKMDGSLEMVTTLPVTGTTAAFALFSAAAVLIFPGALQLGLATGLMIQDVPTPPGYNPAAAVAIISMGAWLALTVGSCLIVGVLLRFTLETLLHGPHLVILGFFAMGGYFLDRYWPDPLATLSVLLESPMLPGILAGGFVLVCACVVLVAFYLARSGFENFQPEPAALN